MADKRYNFIPFVRKSGVLEMADLGGYYIGTLGGAKQEAYLLLSVYPRYEQVSVEGPTGKIEAVVKQGKSHE